MADSPPVITEKSEEFRRVFEELPEVLIQDPARQCAYDIKAEQLQRFEAGPEVWSKVDDSTVTFVIPNNELIDEVPPFLRAPELNPSVLIRYPRGQAAYFLT